MSILSILIMATGLVLAYLNRADEYLLAILVSIATLAATDVARRLSVLEKQFIWQTFLGATIWRRRDIRVSIAYLFSIPVDDEQLLVRGHRITTQFQPVGGVYKTYLSDSEMLRRFDARPDGRFTPDKKSRRDLRVRIPGRNLYKLIRWFKSRQDRELFPIREFHEELINSGLLDKDKFATFDCSYLGLRHLPIKFDKYSMCLQLIMADVYELMPTPEQLNLLRALRAKTANARPDVHFASQTEIERGGMVSAAATTYDLAPTTTWLAKG